MSQRGDGASQAIEVEIVNRQRRHPVDRARVQRMARRAHQAGRGAPGDISILFASDRRLRDLNRAYRGMDRSTDVLSFPDGETDPSGRVHVGDIAISMETAARQAAEVDRLVTHGVLHLIGYDHEADDGQMMALQESVLDGQERGARSR